MPKVITHESRLSEELAVAELYARGGVRTGTCRCCGFPIAVSWTDELHWSGLPQFHWVHCDPDRSEYCRRASFREAGTYADGQHLDRTQNGRGRAAPARRKRGN